MRTAQSFGDDTHAVATGLHLGMRARTSQRCVVPLCRWVKAWLIDGCSNKDAGNVERETPTPCGERNRRQSKRTTHQFYPKPRTHTKQATTPISECSQLSHTHAIELATLKSSLLNAVSHFLFPTSLFLSVFLHVFAFSSSLCLNTLLNAFPLSSSTTPPLSSSLTFISSAFLSYQKPSRS